MRNGEEGKGSETRMMCVGGISDEARIRIPSHDILLFVLYSLSSIEMDLIEQRNSPTTHIEIQDILV